MVQCISLVGLHLCGHVHLWRVWFRLRAIRWIEKLSIIRKAAKQIHVCMSKRLLKHKENYHNGYIIQPIHKVWYSSSTYIYSTRRTELVFQAFSIHKPQGSCHYFYLYTSTILRTCCFLPFICARRNLESGFGFPD